MFNTENCYSNANDFFNTARLIDNKRIDFEYKNLAVAMTNLAFACELYLKFIVFLKAKRCEWIKRGGHDLQSLFLIVISIDKDIADEIESIFEKVKYIDKNLDSFLSIHKNAFVDFRYLHEEEKELNIHTTDLFSFAKILKETCETLIENNGDI